MKPAIISGAMIKTIRLVLLSIFLLSACADSQPPDSVTIAAASNLEPAFSEIGKQFQAETGINTVFSFGATGSLARQIENGAPFDLFAAADLRTVQMLEEKNAFIPGSKLIYARGRLVLWPSQSLGGAPASLNELAEPAFKRISMANPELAPYGLAAKQSLEGSGLWEKIEPKIIYGENVSAAKQYAATGNCEAAFIPLSLVKEGEKFLLVDEMLHSPIEQALCIPKQTRREAAAKKFIEFLKGPKGRAALERFGYVVP